MRGRARGATATICAALLLAGSAAFAHELQPSLLSVRAIGGGRYAVAWKPSQRASGSIALAPSFPSRCVRVGVGVGPQRVAEATGSTSFVLDCGPAGLAGEEIRVSGLDATGTDAVVLFEDEGLEITAALRPDAPSMTIPSDRSSSRLALARTYVSLGFTHILGGPDHLLFLLGLVLLVGRSATARRARALEMARTVTAFTAAHSLTLALAVVGVVHVPPAPVEATIALSVLLLAVELARPGPAPSRRPPWLVALACGLLHGFGFAGALARVGLPSGQIPGALLAFNLGVEAGQLAFVAGVVAVIHGAKSLFSRVPAWVHRVPAYAIGSLAAFWCIDRVVDFWSR